MPTFTREKKVDGPVAGIDEVGRGPLAGPVYAAAVILDPARLPRGIDDSKAMTAEAREKAFGKIMERALSVGIAFASVEEIDEINILQATMLAMRRAAEGLSIAPVHAFVDGNRAPALACPVETIVEGDAKSLSIAAASIVAKVTRDRVMRELDAQHPGYNWASNKGYGTPDHLAALERLGVTVHHRKSFAPVAQRKLPFAG
ncbi:MAG: ribonuclease HII [Alphaproteobacteria bacterium]|nr:ribonuclease HII [Alphaproteobacteria bacterium]